MDRDLKARVNTHAGYSSVDYPREIEWKGSLQVVTKIVKQWREPGSKHYIVECASGTQFKLAYLETNTEWLVTEVVFTSNMEEGRQQ